MDRDSKKQSKPNKSPAAALMREQEAKHAKNIVDATLGADLNAAAVIDKFNVFNANDPFAISEALAESRRAMHNGNLNSIESMLFDQAHALQSIFSNFARRAAMNAGEYIGAADTYLRLALKAQAQCRATLETLAEIKNPQPTAFIRQQNIAANQQVNNGTREMPANTPSCAGKSANEANGLSGVTYEQGKRLDPRTASAPGESHPQMATVAEVYGSEDGSG